MAKISNEYLEVHPYKIIEKGFHKDRALVSESLFSLGNEYSGVRGFFDEDYSDKQLIGTYYNGIYEYSLEDTPSAYKSIVKRTHFTINSLNWLRVQIKVGDEVLDLNKSKFAKSLIFKFKKSSSCVSSYCIFLSSNFANNSVLVVFNLFILTVTFGCVLLNLQISFTSSTV